MGQPPQRAARITFRRPVFWEDALARIVEHRGANRRNRRSQRPRANYCSLARAKPSVGASPGPAGDPFAVSNVANSNQRSASPTSLRANRRVLDIAGAKRSPTEKPLHRLRQRLSSDVTISSTSKESPARHQNGRRGNSSYCFGAMAEVTMAKRRCTLLPAHVHFIRAQFNVDSKCPPIAFLSNAPHQGALQMRLYTNGSDAPRDGWEIIPNLRQTVCAY